jgi:hypothetical protein
MTFLNSLRETREWLTRYLRGQHNWRAWVPSVTHTARYRTLPDSDLSVPKPGALCMPGGGNYTYWYYTDAQLPPQQRTVECEDGPPKWTLAPLSDKYGNIFVYLRGGSQVEFSGEFWAVETQYNGFLDFDVEVYTTDNLAP